MNNSQNYFQNLSKNIRNKISQRSSTNHDNSYISNESTLAEFSSEIDQLFNNKTLDQNLNINGKISCSFLEVDEILIKSIDEDSDLSSITLPNQINNISDLSSISINSSSLENCIISNSIISNNKYYVSQSPSFNYQLLNSIDITPNTENDKGWLGSSYIRNLRSSLNETDYDYFFLDTFGDTYFKTTNGNINIRTYTGNEPNSNSSNIIINSFNNILLSSNNKITFNSNKGIKGIKYNCIQNINNVDLLTIDSNSLIDITLTKLSVVNLPINTLGFNCKIIISDSIDNEHNFILNTNNIAEYLYGYIVYSDNKIESIGNKDNLISKITFDNKNGINLNGTNIDLISCGSKWSIKIYCSELSSLNIINYN